MMIPNEQRELDQWRKENRSLQLELRHEENLTAQVTMFNVHIDTGALVQIQTLHAKKQTKLDGSGDDVQCSY